MLIEQWRETANRVGPRRPLGCRPPAPETLVPAGPLPVLFGLILQLMQRSGAGHAPLLPRSKRIRPHLKKTATP